MPTSPSRLVSFTRLAGRLAIIAGGALGLAAAPHAEASATFAIFDPSTFGPGTLDGVGFTITVNQGGTLGGIKSGNFSGSAFDGSGSQSYIQYSAETVTITFDQAVTDFSLYLFNFRGAPNASGGADQYVFTEDFTPNNNFAGGSRTSPNVLSTPVSWANGILSFTGPITSLSWTSYRFGDPRFVAGNGFTFTGTASASAVPGAGLAGLATVGLAGVARRRRR